MTREEKLWEQVPMLRAAGQPGRPGSQIALAEGCAFGPAVSRVLVILDRPVRAASVTAEKFVVREEKEAYSLAKPRPARILQKTVRKVLSAQAVTAAGRPTREDTPYLMLTLEVSPALGGAMCFDPVGEKAGWCDPYRLHLALSAPLTAADGTERPDLAVDPVPSIGVPCLAGVRLDGVFTGPEGHTLHYASWEPDHPAGEKHPLVIWLHGAGEGGEDPAVTMLGNQVTALLGEEFQSVMGKAYLLAPQTPTFWMQYTGAGAWQDNPGRPSVYHRDLRALIEDYIAGHPGIDPDRVILGGCSNGGYMTMDLILEDPGFFAAAYPICEAYRDAGIRDEQLKKLAESGLPVWFVYAQNDPVVPPAAHAAPTIRRLRAMGANLHATVLPRVTDGDYEYNGHFSWVYFFENRCTDGAENLWHWMARQHR